MVFATWITVVILELIHAFKEILSLLVGFSAFIRFKPMGNVSAFLHLNWLNSG